MATTHTVFGRFLNHYRSLRREGLLDRVPVILSEGDSWFSTPLYYNLVDWLEVAAPSGVFLRMARSGDQATRMFSGANLRRLERRVRQIEFDVVCVSAGGNDLVGDFLRDLFAGANRMNVDQAIAKVLKSRRFDQVHEAYNAMINSMVAARPSIRILAHTYDYPTRMGTPAKLTVEQIGLIALFKRSVGDWIANHIQGALPEEDEQREFSRRLIDHFHDHILTPLQQEHGANFSFVDFRGTLNQEQDWNDEMHPTGDAFRRLAAPFGQELRALLPEDKRAAMG